MKFNKSETKLINRIREYDYDVFAVETYNTPSNKHRGFTNARERNAALSLIEKGLIEQVDSYTARHSMYGVSSFTYVGKYQITDKFREMFGA